MGGEGEVKGGQGGKGEEEKGDGEEKGWSRRGKEERERQIDESGKRKKQVGKVKIANRWKKKKIMRVREEAGKGR